MDERRWTKAPGVPAPAGDDGMNRPDAVLDTNVWLDWLAFEDPVVDPLRAAVRQGRVRLLSLPRGRDELAEVLARPAVRLQAQAARARRRLPPELDLAAVMACFDAVARICPTPPACGLSCRDPDDQCFVDLAVAERARWLFTRDRALLALARQARRRFGLSIAGPASFAEDTGL